MTAGADRRQDEGKPVATMTVFRGPELADGSLDVTAIEAALRTIYPQESFSLEHRAILISNQRHVVFDVYER